MDEMLVNAIAEMQRRGCFTRPLSLLEQLVRVGGDEGGTEALACIPLDVLDEAICKKGNIDVVCRRYGADSEPYCELRTSRIFDMALFAHVRLEIEEIPRLFHPVELAGVSRGCCAFVPCLKLHGEFNWDDVYRGSLVLSMVMAWIDAVASDQQEPAHVVEAFGAYGYSGEWVEKAERSMRDYDLSVQAACNVLLPANLKLLVGYGLLDQVVEAAKEDPFGGAGNSLFCEYMIYADVVAEALAAGLELSPHQVGVVLWSDFCIMSSRYSRTVFRQLETLIFNSKFKGANGRMWAGYSTSSAGRILEYCLLA